MVLVNVVCVHNNILPELVACKKERFVVVNKNNFQEDEEDMLRRHLS